MLLNCPDKIVNATAYQSHSSWDIVSQILTSVAKGSGQVYTAGILVLLSFKV